MFTYADGSSIEVGDAVLLERGTTPGTVELVVVTPAEMQVSVGAHNRPVIGA